MMVVANIKRAWGHSATIMGQGLGLVLDFS